MSIPKNAKLWIQALRSGEFKQGLTSLCQKREKQKTYRYCCLGVACEVAIQNGVYLNIEEEALCGDVYVYYNGESEKLANKLDVVRRWLGLRKSSIKGELRDPVEELIYMNDEGKSFKTIANELEANPNKYFNPAKCKEYL